MAYAHCTRTQTNHQHSTNLATKWHRKGLSNFEEIFAKIKTNTLTMLNMLWVLSSNDDFRDVVFSFFPLCIVVDVMRTQYTLDWRATPSLNCLILAVLIVATMLFFHHLPISLHNFCSFVRLYVRTYVRMFMLLLTVHQKSILWIAEKP